MVLVLLLAQFFLYPERALTKENNTYIQSETESNNIVATYLKYNKTTEAYLLDLLVANNHHGNKVAKLSNSGMYYFYEAQEYYLMHKEGKISSLDKAIQSIDMAIKKDPIALNYFFKSFLLSKQGANAKSDKIFIEGIGKPYDCTYTTRGSIEFVKMISASVKVNVYNIYWFSYYIDKIRIDSDFYIYVAKKLKKYIRETALPVNRKQNITCGMIRFVNVNSKAFYIHQDNIINITNSFLNNLPEEYVSKSCVLNYDPEALKEPEDYMAIQNRIKKTKDVSHFKEALFWRNFQSIAQDLKNRRKP
jgi:hypothetical protein